MVKLGNLKIGIVANPQDLKDLEFLKVKLGLKATQIYRLALRYYAREERSKKD